MRDYSDETAFLVHLLSYHESPKSKDVLDRIARTQRDQACVFKATCAAGLLGLQKGTKKTKAAVRCPPFRVF